MCACTHIHTHTHTHTQCSHLRGWPAMRVGLTGIKMLVVSQPSPRTASTSSANLPVQGLVLSLTGLETGSCQSPEDQDSGILTQSNTHRGLVSRPVVGVFICRESSECRVAQHEWACLGFMSLETAMDMACSSMCGESGSGVGRRGGWRRGKGREDGRGECWEKGLMEEQTQHRPGPSPSPCIRLCHFAPSAPMWGFQGLTISPSPEIYLFTGVTGSTSGCLCEMCLPCSTCSLPLPLLIPGGHPHLEGQVGITQQSDSAGQRMGCLAWGSWPVSHCCSSAGWAQTARPPDPSHQRSVLHAESSFLPIVHWQSIQKQEDCNEKKIKLWL